MVDYLSHTKVRLRLRSFHRKRRIKPRESWLKPKVSSQYKRNQYKVMPLKLV
jgi:hypothetical protein